MRQNPRCLIALEAKSAPIITMLVQSMYALIVLFIYIFSFMTFPLTAHNGLLDIHSTCIFSYLSRVLEGFALDVCSLSLNLSFFLHGFVLM